MKKFKDSCDNCHKFDFCRGYKDRVLCEECIEKGFGDLAPIVEEKKAKEREGVLKGQYAFKI